MAVVDMYGNKGPGGPGKGKKKAMKKTKYSKNAKSCSGNFKSKGKSSCGPKKDGVIKKVVSKIKAGPKKKRPTTTTTTTSKTAKGRIGTPVKRKKKEEIVVSTPSFSSKSKNPRFL
jgi:hypothetical protein